MLTFIFRLKLPLLMTNLTLGANNLVTIAIFSYSGNSYVFVASLLAELTHQRLSMHLSSHLLISISMCSFPTHPLLVAWMGYDRGGPKQKTYITFTVTKQCIRNEPCCKVGKNIWMYLGCNKFYSTVPNKNNKSGRNIFPKRKYAKKNFPLFITWKGYLELFMLLNEAKHKVIIFGSILSLESYLFGFLLQP